MWHVRDNDDSLRWHVLPESAQPILDDLLVVLQGRSAQRARFNPHDIVETDPYQNERGRCVIGQTRDGFDFVERPVDSESAADGHTRTLWKRSVE